MQIVRAETEFNHGHPVPTERPEQEFGDLDPPLPYQVGVQCRWLVGDFRHLMEVWKSPPPVISWQVSSPAAQASRRTRPKPGRFHDNFVCRDPLLGDWICLLQQAREPHSQRETSAC
jgi:hypothetical protein